MGILAIITFRKFSSSSLQFQQDKSYFGEFPLKVTVNSICDIVNLYVAANNNIKPFIVSWKRNNGYRFHCWRAIAYLYCYQHYVA
jgi:hypothetical protein